MYMKDLSYEIIICSYNGEKYIHNQIESILKSSRLPSRIILSDDGSTDSTINRAINIFKSYNYRNYKVLSGPRQGIISNYLVALNYTNSNYIFLADQDDIWISNKIETFFSYINKCNLSEHIPQLYFSDAELIDDSGNHIAGSFFNYQGITPAVLSDDSIIYKNCVQGASCCINKALRDLVLSSLNQVNIKNLYMHDWWIALLAKYYGESYFIEKPTLLYRQHQNNQVGTFNKNWKLFYYFRNLRKFIANFILATKQMKELEKFNNVIPSNILKSRSERKYRYVSLLKRCIIYLFRL
ncbi:glycosyltransferase family 2 protein [Avibacterium sp. 21-599]|uniref:glycosyltransferase family 2 protein n=1 Tax=Avibacterium sp. 21-599 TaxID=2911528 RepID=UPI002245E114|nr:glycosyltransferase family 2 protein [Avibacterium sp. 21-599]MCW9718780.1 glycosyltransferase family 2 protein [Avibacterium sp. 21-599]